VVGALLSCVLRINKGGFLICSSIFLEEARKLSVFLLSVRTIVDNCIPFPYKRRERIEKKR
jgi:hypothetical protein